MMAEYQVKVYREAIEQLAAISVMASANFPRDTGIKVSTTGPGPSASCTISASVVDFLLQAAQNSLADEGKE
jgi:hypothetical protein